MLARRCQPMVSSCSYDDLWDTCLILGSDWRHDWLLVGVCVTNCECWFLPLLSEDSWWREVVSWGLNASELRVSTLESRQAPLATRIPLQKQDWTRRLQNHPWGTTHGGNSETIQCARRLPRPDKPTWGCGALTEDFSHGLGLQFFSVFGDWLVFSEWTTIRCVKTFLLPIFAQKMSEIWNLKIQLW